MNRFLNRGWEAFLAIFVIAVAALLLVPLPTSLLDLLLVANIGFSLMLLFLGLYISSAQSLLTFPALLLLATLFRLSLNVASTRLILSQGDAGQVIDAFGRFLVGGEIVVGIVVFIIVTIVNFVVIARGAARVSEVGARFALDALPGKQMAIEADIRSGALTATEAQGKREELRRESQFYGAMDGSMKFVQGDAIAGVLIIVTNILGGMYIGISQGMSFSEAGQMYTILTIGDGLVTQFPALLISICAGIVVTRVSSAENVTLSRDILSQLFGKPLTLVATGAILIFASLLPSIPMIPFILVGSGFLFIAYRVSRTTSSNSSHGTSSLSLPPGRQLPDFSRDLPLRGSNLEIVIDHRLLSKNEWEKLESSHEKWGEIRADFYSQTGLSCPEPAFRSSSDLGLGEYRVLWKGGEILSGVIPLDCLAIEVAPSQVHVFGAELVEEVQHPLDGSLISWVAATNIVKNVSSKAQLRSISPVDFIALRSLRYLRDNPELILGVGEVHLQIKDIERRMPGFVEEVLDRKFLTVARLAEISQCVVRSGLGNSDLQQLLEELAAYKSSYAGSGLSTEDYDLWHIIHFIRMLRRKQIVSNLLGDQNVLRLVSIDSEAQSTIARCAITEGRDTPILSAKEFRSIIDPLKEVILPVSERGRGVVAVLCPVEIWRQVRALLHAAAIDLPLVSTNDIEPTIGVEYIGVWHTSGSKL